MHEFRKTIQDGRDEMNLADFPISALQRQQPCDADGRKLDTIVYEASRYDPVKRQRVAQRVILTTSSEEGLPTPADEHVILALLFLAKHGNNFQEPTVSFSPGPLFEIMGWATNGRSYERLRRVLRRLKALTVRYENAWWDAAGRGYEEELATGIIAEYRIARQVSGPRKPGTVPRSWVRWTPQFHESLLRGNIKRLNLELFFRLRSPTAQRMYRFLDKRFYTSAWLRMDLIEFACGHVGLTETRNVAVLKRRLAPALKELEEIGFIIPAGPEERYQKVQPGVWRIQLQADPATRTRLPVEGPPAPADLPPPEAGAPLTPEALAQDFYQRWDPTQPARPGPKDLERARALLEAHGEVEARAVIAWLVRLTKKEWPECRSLSGAVQKYLPDAVQAVQRESLRQERQREARTDREEEAEEVSRQQSAERHLQQRWDQLSPAEQDAIRRAVQEKLGDADAPEAFRHRLCLEELARRMDHSAPALPG